MEEGDDITTKVVSDGDIREKLRAILPDADLETTTEKQLRKQLEKHFGCDLKDRKPVFKEEIESFLLKNQDLFEDENSGGEEEEEEEKPKKTKKRTGLAKRQILSEKMQSFLGCDENANFSRPEVVKLIWAYINEHDLKDPKNRRNIVADEKLKLIFTFPLNMFTLNKQLSKHLKSSDSTISSSDAPAKKRPKKKHEPENCEKKKTGFAAPQKLSEALAEVVGQPAASRGEVMKALWQYVKERDLQNPDNKKVILVSKDEKLRGVLGVDKCEGFGMSKYLKDHFLGPAD